MVDDLPSGNTLYVTVPPETSLKKLAEIILDLTEYDEIHPKLRAADAWKIDLHRFSVVGIKAVIIDECHHMLPPGPGKDVRTAIQPLECPPSKMRSCLNLHVKPNGVSRSTSFQRSAQILISAVCSQATSKSLQIYLRSK